MKLRWPWRRRILAADSDGAVLVNDTTALCGDELIEVAPGRFIRVADLMAGLDVIETVSADDLDWGGQDTR